MDSGKIPVLDTKKTIACAAVALLFFAAALYRAYMRPAYVSAAAAEQNSTISLEEDRRLPLTITDKDEGPSVKWQRDDLEIPLPEGVNRNDILVESHWSTGEIRVHFTKGAEASYLEEVICADKDKVTAGTLIPDGADGMVLCFTTDRVYEVTSAYRSDALSGGREYLSLHFTPPRELYEKIVVIDAAGGGSDAEDERGEEIALSVSEIVRERMEDDVKETGVRVYVTRNADETVDDETRIAFADAVDADLFLRICVTDDAEKTGISVSYNELFFRRGLNNARLSDILLRHVAVATDTPASGLYPAYGEDAVLTSLTIPAASVSLGSTEDAGDMARLDGDNDLKKAADGICKAVLEAAGLCD